MVFHHQINKMQKFFLRKSLVCRCGISPQETFSARDCHLLGWLLWRQSVTRATCCSGPVEAGGPQGPWPSLRRGAIMGKTRKTVVSPWLCKTKHGTQDCHLLGWLLWRQSVMRATCCSGAAEAGGPQGPWLPHRFWQVCSPYSRSDYAHHINNLMSVTCATSCSAEGSGRTRGTMLSYPRYSWSRKENRSRSKSGSRNRHSFTVVPRPTDPWNLHRLNCWYQDTWEIELEIG